MGTFTLAFRSPFVWTCKFNNGLCVHFSQLPGLKSSRNSSCLINRWCEWTLRSLALSAGWPEPNLKWFKVESGGNLQELKNDDKHTINILLNHANILQPHVCIRYYLQYFTIKNGNKIARKIVFEHLIMAPFKITFAICCIELQS